MQPCLRSTVVVLGLILTALSVHVVQGAEIPWVYSYNTAVQRARAERKQVFLMMGRESCGTCLSVKQKLAKEGPLAVLTANYIAWYVTVDDSGEHVKYYANKEKNLNLPLLVVFDPVNEYPERAFYDGYITTNGLEGWLETYAVETQTEITGFMATAGHRRVTLNWNAPGAGVADGVVIVRGEGLQPTDEAVTVTFNAQSGNFELTVSDTYAGQADRFAVLTPDALAPTATSLVDPVQGAAADALLTNDVPYYYRAFTVDATNALSSGVTANATPSFDQVALNGLQAVAGDGAVEISWIHPDTDPDRSDIAGVLVARSLADDFPDELNAGFPFNAGQLLAAGSSAVAAGIVDTTARGTMNWTDQDLDPDTAGLQPLINGTTYYYKLYAFTAVHEYTSAIGDAQGQAASAVPSFSQAQPTNVTAIGEPDRILVNWTAPQSASLDGILVVRKLNAQPDPTLSAGAAYGVGATLSDNSKVVYVDNAPTPGQPPQTAWIDTNVTRGQPHHYAIYAFDSARNYALPGRPAGPAVPTMDPHDVVLADGSPQAGNSSMAFTWQNPDVAGFGGVIVFRHQDPDRTLPVAPPADFPVDGETPDSYLTRTGEDAAVAVLTVADDGLLAGAQTDWTDDGVLNGEFYSYAFYAFSSAFDYSAPTVWTPQTNADKPSFSSQTVTLIGTQPRSTSITLNWTNPGAPNLLGILVVGKKGTASAFVPEPGKQYTTAMNPPDPAGGFVDIVNVSDGTTCTHSDLLYGENYVYRIFAYDTDYRYSDPVEAGPVETGFSCAAYDVRAATAGYLGIDLTWTAPAQTDAEGLVVLRSTTGRPVIDLPTDAEPDDLDAALAGTGITSVHVRQGVGGQNTWLLKQTGLEDGQTYWYGVYLFDQVNGAYYYCYSEALGGSFSMATASADLDRDGMDDQWEHSKGVRDPNAHDLAALLPNRLKYLEETAGLVLPDQNIILYQGWNMVAFPPTENTRGCRITAGELLGDLISGPAWAWDAAEQVYKDMTDQAVEEGVGYWLFAPQVSVVDLGQLLPPDGALREDPAPCSFHKDFLIIFRGWNMVGAPDWALGTGRDTTVKTIWGDAARQREITDQETGEVIGTAPLIWRWSGAKQAYVDAGGETVAPTSAYWFNAPDAGVIVNSAEN